MAALLFFVVTRPILDAYGEITCGLFVGFLEQPGWVTERFTPATVICDRGNRQGAFAASLFLYDRIARINV